jgi:hypothetical protein
VLRKVPNEHHPAILCIQKFCLYVPEWQWGHIHAYQGFGTKKVAPCERSMDVIAIKFEELGPENAVVKVESSL